MIKHIICADPQALSETIENYTAEEIIDMRGLRIKVFDFQNQILNSRHWNPLHFAIHFKQKRAIEILY